jgi:hypothetical protein
MKLMLNNTEYIYDIAPHEMDFVEVECIVSVSESGRILSMNSTASYIWKKIIEKHGEQADISDENIVHDILKDFELDEDEYENVLEDVTDVFNLLLNSELLLKVNNAA